MGGWIALKLAADHPKMVGRLVLYDAAGVYFRMDYDGSLFTPTDAAGVDRLLQRLTPKRVNLPGFIAMDLLRRIGRNAWVVHRNVASMTSGRDLMEFRLGEIHAPTLILWERRIRSFRAAQGNGWRPAFKARSSSRFRAVGTCCRPSAPTRHCR